ncbi:MAG TPA: hypothetical protein VI072_19790 [Polyangiaceae bacterium]
MPHDNPPRDRSARSLRRATLALLGSGIACATLLTCKRPTSTGESPLPSASAPLPAGSSVPERCTAAAKGAVFTLGKAGPRAPADADDEPAAQPFAVEIGDAAALETGFAVTALQSSGAETRALIASIPPDAARGKVVDLGRVHGDAEPPRLAAQGARIFFALADHDPASARLRVGMLAETGGSLQVTWGFETSRTGRGASAFDLAVTRKRGLLVWEEMDARAERQLVRVASFSLENPAAVTEPKTLAAGSLEQEMPAAVPRGSGYWLAWVASAPTPRPGAAAGARPTVKPSRVAPEGSSDPAPSVLDFGNRWIEIVALDENAAPIGAPQAVTPRDRHVLIFDLAESADGGALLAWRDDDSAPGAESRIVHLARVNAGGAVERFVIDDEEVGAGAPSLLSDTKASAPTWLALESVTHDTRIAALSARGDVLDELRAEGAIGNADVLAARDGRLLLGRPRGLAAELRVVACKPGAPKTAPRASAH